MRLERALNDHVYWGIEAGGAVDGGGGLARAASRRWHRDHVLARRSRSARGALGIGGGGAIDTGGGLLLKGGVYGTLRPHARARLTLEGGWTGCAAGQLRRARIAAASLNWILDDPTDRVAPRATCAPTGSSASSASTRSATTAARARSRRWR
jgi:hypothetical protein